MTITNCRPYFLYRKLFTKWLYLNLQLYICRVGYKYVLKYNKFHIMLALDWTPSAAALATDCDLVSSLSGRHSREELLHQSNQAGLPTLWGLKINYNLTLKLTMSNMLGCDDLVISFQLYTQAVDSVLRHLSSPD